MSRMLCRRYLDPYWHALCRHERMACDGHVTGFVSTADYHHGNASGLLQRVCRRGSHASLHLSTLIPPSCCPVHLQARGARWSKCAGAPPTGRVVGANLA